MLARRTIVLLSIALFTFLSGANGQGSGTGSKDLVNGLPGLRYPHTYQQYAGYLNTTDGTNAFYWFIGSQSNTATKDPIIVWLSPYPGCSSLIGLMKEIGPFRTNTDGMTLFENVFSWNKFANLLFIDAPANTGWSYSSSSKPTTPSDDAVATEHYSAIQNFYVKFPSYNTSDLYLVGETYGGVYVPTLARKIADAMTQNQFPKVLKGIAIGNGILSAKNQFNAMIHYFYNHGLIGTETWDDLRRKCSCWDSSEESCGFYSAITTNPTGDCGKALNSTIQLVKSNTTTDAGNIFRDCYVTSSSPPRTSGYYADMLDAPIGYFPPTTAKKTDTTTASKNAPWSAYDPAHNINYDSTDALLGFTCWGDETKYLSQKNVMSALHVSSTLTSKPFVSCPTTEIAYNRSNTYMEMAPTIAYLLQKTNIRILFYSGDLDMEYNFLGLEWFIDRGIGVDPALKLKVIENRGPWTYRGQTAGFMKRYSGMDEVIIKGAGRYVATDRGGPALQMIYNFVYNKTYSTATNLVLTPKPNSAPATVANIPFMTMWVELTLLFIGFVASRL